MRKIKLNPGTATNIKIISGVGEQKGSVTGDFREDEKQEFVGGQKFSPSTEIILGINVWPMKNFSKFEILLTVTVKRMSH